MIKNHIAYDANLYPRRSDQVFIPRDYGEGEQEINKALLCDSELQKQYKELILVKTQLDATHIEPSEASVNNILSYTRSLQEKN